MPKILAIDIEWRPALAYVWRMWDESIRPEQLIDHGGMLCFCAHWVGTKEYQFYSEWQHGRKGMAEAALALLSDADAVLTYNGDRYDLPKITGEILLAGLTPPPPVASIDVIKTIKKLGFNMNRLAYIGPLLKLGAKVKHQGFNLWKDVMNGDAKAQKQMERYCVQDVRLLVKLYQRVLPFIRNHPFVGGGPASKCPNCGSDKVQRRGVRRTRSYVIERRHCQSCGGWSDGTRKKIT